MGRELDAMKKKEVEHGRRKVIEKRRVKGTFFYTEGDPR